MKRTLVLLVLVVAAGIGGVLTLGAGDERVTARAEPTTRLYVRTVPPGAAVKIDGKRSGNSDRLFQMPAGVKTILVEVELDGRDDRKEVIVRGGRITRVEFDLTPPDEAEVKPAVVSMRDAVIRIDLARELQEAKAELQELRKHLGPRHQRIVDLETTIHYLEQTLAGGGPTAGALLQDGLVRTLPPVVVETVPVSGDTAVDPSTSEIRVTFSKEMTDGSWAWTTASDDTNPEITGTPRYLGDKRTCVLPVKLEGGRTYAFWLNSNRFKAFKDAEGRPAVPYLLIFETRPK